MSVYTTVSESQLQAWLAHYSLGELKSLKGIAAGVTNTNYFVTTESGRYVLTLFETLTAQELPFYLNVMDFLAKQAIPVPAPIFDNTQGFVRELCGKPACLVSCLSGSDLTAPNLEQSTQLASLLAKIHQLAQHFPEKMPNPRGATWRIESAMKLMNVLSVEENQLLNEELLAHAPYLAHWETLPRGLIHADLFRDNVLFLNNQVSGIIDWYYACDDTFLYDLAIVINDWCMLPNGELEDERARAMLTAYQHIRPFTSAERAAWPLMLRVAAMRFWLSRLLDFHFPQSGEMTFAKDPNVFRSILETHRARKTFWLD